MLRRFLAAVAIVIGALALTATYRYVRPGDLEPLGGEWYIKPVSVYWAGHSGNWHDLYRKSGPWFVRVDAQLSLYRYYPPDCVLFESSRQGITERTTGLSVPGVTMAACGTHNPVAIEANSGRGRYENEGLVTHFPAGERAGAWQSESTEVIPIAAIRELANRQPPYRRGWRTHASFDVMSPVKGIRR